MLNPNITPMSIPGIKKLAKSLKAELAIPHHEALDQAAQRGKFANYAHALHCTARRHGQISQRLPHLVQVSAHWRNRAANTLGTERLYLPTSKPLTQLVKSHQLTGRLGGSTITGADHIADQYHWDDADQARWNVRRLANTLRFMDATGLRPSASHGKWPHNIYDNRIPGCDHTAVWYDPATKRYLITDEPYTDSAEYRADERQLWSDKFGQVALFLDWKGLHNPSEVGGTRLFLIGKLTDAEWIASLARTLDAYPGAILEKDWDRFAKPF
ncbi:MAG: hypothetical protein IPK89_13360 [Sphingomonadales bacterium]|nr:hypothetical protein [Sphingomonadales bacterium]